MFRFSFSRFEKVWLEYGLKALKTFIPLNCAANDGGSKRFDLQQFCFVLPSKSAFANQTHTRLNSSPRLPCDRGFTIYESRVKLNYHQALHNGTQYFQKVGHFPTGVEKKKLKRRQFRVIFARQPRPADICHQHSWKVLDCNEKYRSAADARCTVLKVLSRIGEKAFQYIFSSRNSLGNGGHQMKK